MQRRELLAAATTVLAPLRAPAQVQGEAGWPAALLMSTAGPGGTYAVYGPVWGGLVARATGLPVSYRATQGPRENILLLDRGSVDLGMTTMGVARQAWEGVGEWTGGVRLRGFRALFPMYETPFHGMARRGAGIVSLASLSGKRAGVGPRGGTAGLYVPAMLRLLGVGGVRVAFGTIADQVRMVAAGTLDACVIAAGAPIPAYAEAAARTPMMFFGPAPAEIAKLTASLPELSPDLVARGTYRGLEGDLPSVGMFNFAIGRAGLPDDLVYRAVAAVLGAPAAMRAAGPEAAQTIAANARRDGFLPFHPGAARYYRAYGVALPPGLG